MTHAFLSFSFFFYIRRLMACSRAVSLVLVAAIITAASQLGNESWAFNPPETLGGALLKGNLPGLYSWDSWSCGVALAALCMNSGQSPFAAEADVSKLTFSTQVLFLRFLCRSLYISWSLLGIILLELVCASFVFASV